MGPVKTLDQLPVGGTALVKALNVPGPQKRRLMDLGFVPGRRVSAVQESPWGDPVAYAACGAVVALRRSDARRIACEAI